MVFCSNRLSKLLVGVLACPGIGCNLIGGVLPSLGNPSPEVKITAVRSGCSEFSRSVVISAAPSLPNLRYEWYFPDGMVHAGPTVVHTFDSTGQHQVSLIANGEVVSASISVPVGGEAAPGPDPLGDDCIDDEGRIHVPQGTNVSYRSNPPASGPHYSVAGVAPIAEGFYENPVAPEVWVHNLEHGDVVILFDCPGNCPQDLLDALRRFSSSIQHNLVVTRYPGLSSTIIAVAWDVQRKFDSFDAVELRAFHDRRVGQAPENE